jgi:RHS repeat-associated protein
VTNAKNETTTLTYDTSGYLQTITGPLAGSTVTLTWDGFGRVRTVAYDGRTVTFSYDAIDRVTRVDYPDGTYEEVTYKLLDPETYRDRQGQVSRLFHDTLQRLVAFQDPQGRLVKQTWCECGDLEKLIDAAGNETTWFRDLQGRVTQQLRANGSSSSVTYENTTSRVKKVTDAKLQDVLYEYFADDSLKRVSFANAANPPAPVNFTYDASYPRVLTKTDGQGLTTYGYNAIGTPPALGAGQLASIDGPLTNDTITLGYDQLGRVVSRAINGVAESVAFDTLGRLQSVTNLLGTFNYSYVGTTERLQTLAYPNGQSTELSYHPANQDHRLQQILHKKPGGALLSRHAYTYEPSGNIKSWTQETDVSAAKVYDFEYDRTDQLTAATLKTTDPTPAVLKRYVYGYDPAGNRTSEQIDNGVTSALHNNMNQTQTLQPGGMLRLAGTTNEAASVTIAGQPAQILPGNRFQGETPVGSGTTSVPVVATDGSGNARTYTYNVSVSGSTKTLTYDPNGNLISDGLRTYEWDALDQLTAINQGTHRSEFTYDSEGLRVRIVEKESGVVTQDRRLLWDDGAEVAEERDVSGTVLKRHLAGGVQQSGASYFSFGDHLGSVRELTDATGAARARYDFDGYGRRTKTAGDLNADFGFAGTLAHGATGLGLAVFRGYDPERARWLNEDPIGLDGGLNFYAYAQGNPTLLTDPLGLDPWWQNALNSAPMMWLVNTWSANLFGGIGHNLSLGATTWINQKLGNPVNQCDPAFGAGQKIGIVIGLAAGAAGLLKAGVSTLSGTAFNARHMLAHSASHRTFARHVWQGGSAGRQLHHWMVPQRVFNSFPGWMQPFFRGGWNTIPISGPLNWRVMGFWLKRSSLWKRGAAHTADWTIRSTMIGMLTAPTQGTGCP